MLNAKRRIITVKDSVVTSESFDFFADTECAFTDPLGVFSVGSVFSADRYALVYKTHPYAKISGLESVYIIPAINNEEEIFLAAGLRTNIQPHRKSKYVYLSAESDSLLFEIAEYSKFHGVKTPNFTLVNKETVTQKYIDAGFPTLLTTLVRTRGDIVSFPFEKIILKPLTATNSQSIGHPLETALYIIKTKTELLNILDGLGAFNDPNILANKPIIAQQVADSNGDNFDALILSGAVNGTGDVWHFAPIELATQYNDTGRLAKTVWSAENNTSETAQLQQCAERLLANTGSVNCFYQIQFLRSNGVWTPHDFQYRMTYYMSFGLEPLGYSQHKVDAIKFTFDQSTQKPPQPTSFGLSHRSPRVGKFISNFVEGASKAEVLAKLELL